MKRVYMLVCIVFLQILSYAQTYIEASNIKTNAEILYNSDNKIIFSNTLKGFYVNEYNVNGENYIKISVKEYHPNMDIGYPELPVMTKLLEIPIGADIEIKILKTNKVSIDLAANGAYYPIFPNQPSLSKSEDVEKVEFIKEESIYSEKNIYIPEVVQVEKSGKMRGVQIAQLIVNPFSYDINSNTLDVITDMEVEISFNNFNIEKSTKQKVEKYSPVFEQNFRRLWNNKNSVNAKVNTAINYPIKYVIVADRMFEEVLQPFIKWKAKKGFDVVTVYTDEIGGSTSDIKTYVQNLYNNTEGQGSAPSYLLLVGDIEQVPTFSVSRFSSPPYYATDLYYCTFDGEDDYIPDMYYGRFSANTVEELKPQIEKTLMYEQYTFSNPEFLDNALLVVGTDDFYSQIHCNGQMNYVNNYYLNQDNGINTNKYLYPESKNKLAEIKEKINAGVSFVNYSAHCNEKGWSKPDFRIPVVKQLENEDMYFFSVSNCCLSSKYNDYECFGETLVREDKKGAVVHIGASENTYWNEDFYWSVGLIGNFNQNPTYEETGVGMYDHWFHENGEEPYVTAGQMIFGGNMSVGASTSELKKYYWEVYNVLGDPSLMPYIGKPSGLHAVALPESIKHKVPFITVLAEPDTYVAISNNENLIDAAIADQDGWAQLNLPELPLGTNLDIIMTRQFREPFFSSLQVVANDDNNDIGVKSIIKPFSVIHSDDLPLTPEFEIINLGLNNLTTAKVGYRIDNNNEVEKNWTGNLDEYESEAISFPQIALPDANYTFTAYVDNPNGQNDENADNNNITKKFMIYSGKAKIEEIVTPSSIICNTDTLIPEIIVKNTDNYPLRSLVCKYECGNVSGELLWTGNLQPESMINIEFPINSFPEGNNTIKYSISEPNGGMFYDAVETIDVETNFRLLLNGNSVELDLLTDIYGSENRWELIDLNSGNIIYSDGPFVQGKEINNIYDWCLSDGCYEFVLYDSFNDGMAGSPILGYPPGRIKITNKINNEILVDISGEDFKGIYKFRFCFEDICCPNDLKVAVYDPSFELTGALPVGGKYSGVGMSNGIFYPNQAGVGQHLITYTYEFADGERSCSFYINVTLVNIEQTSSYEQLQVYPNPTTGKLTIKTAESLEIINILLLNATGQTLAEIPFVRKTTEINADISNYAPGTYFIKIIEKDGIITRKVIVER